VVAWKREGARYMQRPTRLGLPSPFFMTAQASAFFSFMFVDLGFTVFFYT
jgi:hypothetical protein